MFWVKKSTIQHRKDLILGSIQTLECAKMNTAKLITYLFLNTYLLNEIFVRQVRNITDQ